MKIGCLKEIKTHEYRVGLTPDGARAFLKQGHEVAVQSGAGIGSGFPDEAYREAGARLVEDPAGIFRECGMIVKVKEPQPSEVAQLREGQILYTYLHLAADEALARYGALKAARRDPVLARGLNAYDGRCTCPAVAAAFGMECASPF